MIGKNWIDAERWAGVILLVLVFAGCSAAPTSVTNEAELVFDVEMGMVSGGEIRAVAAIHNVGKRDLAEDSDFDGIWLISGMDNAQRMCTETIQFGALGAGRSAFPVEWKGRLDPGDYQMVWGAPDHGGMKLEFSVVEQGDGLALQVSDSEVVVVDEWHLSDCSAS